MSYPQFSFISKDGTVIELSDYLPRDKDGLVINPSVNIGHAIKSFFPTYYGEYLEWKKVREGQLCELDKIMEQCKKR